MISDQVIIMAIAGKGGNGAVSFRRERFIPKGGPDGGDGGKGGDVLIKADPHTNNLLHLYRHPHCKAEDGENGKGQRKNGKNGKNLCLSVPVGTIVENPEEQKIIADLSRPGEEICIAIGGKGGKGNYRFRSSTRQSPKFAQKGEPGQEKKIKLNLKMIADVGLVGLPNAGKSTLLSRISSAKPKIANYPFTTIEPKLGVVMVDEENSFIVADIPGLIEGAHRGVGLGTRFLKHIERTKILIHIIDGSKLLADKLYYDYQVIENELKKYPANLDKKEKVVVINKCDLPEVKAKMKIIKQFFLKKGIEILFISAIDGKGLKELIYYVQSLLQSSGKEQEDRKVRVKGIAHYHYKPSFVVKKEAGIFYVEGEKINQLVNQFDLDNPQALEYFQKNLKNMGIEKALKKKGISEGDKVKIDDKVFYFSQ